MSHSVGSPSDKNLISIQSLWGSANELSRTIVVLSLMNLWIWQDCLNILQSHPRHSITADCRRPNHQLHCSISAMPRSALCFYLSDCLALSLAGLLEYFVVTSSTFQSLLIVEVPITMLNFSCERTSSWRALIWRCRRLLHRNRLQLTRRPPARRQPLLIPALAAGVGLWAELASRLRSS